MRGDGSARCRPAVIEWRELTPGTRPVTPDEPSDIELWGRAVDGDHESFSVLFERHARSVYNHCFRRTACWADAKELTSAVFRRRGGDDVTCDRSANPRVRGCWA